MYVAGENKCNKGIGCARVKALLYQRLLCSSGMLFVCQCPVASHAYCSIMLLWTAVSHQWVNAQKRGVLLQHVIMWRCISVSASADLHCMPFAVVDQAINTCSRNGVPLEFDAERARMYIRILSE